MRFKRLGELFESYHHQLYLTAMAITKSRELAEDAVHEALIAVSESSTEPKNLKACVFTAVRNKAVKLLIYRNKHMALSDFIEPFEELSEETVVMKSVFKLLDELDGTQQQVIIMKTLGDMTFQEIADCLDKSINTVSSSYRRGIERIQEKIND
ncbi:RNA polymerase sigma factor [Kangiella sp. TOML190]|uniref:RNA polymerase sigma factor n=1 Tax=Kangiella sp. TOML190 TaxID=2931351 RepID=UPI00203E64BD|nr:sigma-70 family RNA polymerase sigma factor [Kangiella sp. TOML190]